MTTEIPDSVTYREVQEILRTFRDSGWTGLTLEVRGLKVTVGKTGPPSGSVAAPAAPRPSPPHTDERDSRTYLADESPARPARGAAPVGSGPLDTTGLTPVFSPAVGAFWVAPAPGQPPFVEVGQTVAAGDQLAIVEVMKLMNPVIAEAAGEVVAVVATNAEMVEYEQVLFWIRPADA